MKFESFEIIFGAMMIREKGCCGEAKWLRVPWHGMRHMHVRSTTHMFGSEFGVDKGLHVQLLGQAHSRPVRIKRGEQPPMHGILCSPHSRSASFPTRLMGSEWREGPGYSGSIAAAGLLPSR